MIVLKTCDWISMDWHWKVGETYGEYSNFSPFSFLWKKSHKYTLNSSWNNDSLQFISNFLYGWQWRAIPQILNYSMKLIRMFCKTWLNFHWLITFNPSCNNMVVCAAFFILPNGIGSTYYLQSYTYVWHVLIFLIGTVSQSNQFRHRQQPMRPRFKSQTGQNFLYLQIGISDGIIILSCSIFCLIRGALYGCMKHA